MEKHMTEGGTRFAQFWVDRKRPVDGFTGSSHCLLEWEYPHEFHGEIGVGQPGECASEGRIP